MGNTWSQVAITVVCGLEYVSTALRDLFCASTVISDLHNIASLDQLLLNKGLTQRLNLEQNQPINGFHIYSPTHSVFPLLLSRRNLIDSTSGANTSVYDVIALPIISWFTNPIFHLWQDIRAEEKKAFEEKDDDEVKEEVVAQMVYRCFSLNMFTHQVSGEHLWTPSKPRIQQLQVMNLMLQNLQNQRNLCVLLSGKEGTGKSLVARFLARNLQQPHKLIENVNLSQPGLSLEMHILPQRQCNAKQWLIILVDEIDVAMIESVNPQPANQDSGTYTISKNKISMCNFFDLARSIDRFILISTCNSSLETIQTKFPAYFRRFHVKYEFHSQ
jgi:hypothetical protein